MDDSSARDKRAALPRGHAKLGQLSPAFISTDDAARYIHEQIGSQREVEYASVILRRLSDNLYVASEPRAGKPTTFDWNLLLDREHAAGEFVNPEGYQIVASLHSHPSSLDFVKRTYPKWTLQQMQAFMSFYSTPDIYFNHQDRARFIQAYLSGPDGALLRYTPSNSAAEAGFVHWLDTNGPWSSPHAHDGTLEGIYKKLAAVGRLTFVQSSAAWGSSTGDVPADWQPYQPFSAPAMPLPCGPVFTSAEQALSYAWSRIQRAPTARQRVLLLKHDLQELFVAAQPELTSTVSDQLPLLPTGLHLLGIYFHSRPLPGQYPDLDAWLYKNFVSPLELATHIAQFRQYALGAQSTLGVSLYIRMRDEAILRYRFSGSAAETALFTRSSTGEVGDNGTQAALQAGTLLTRAFVLRVAAAGELTVEKTSALWDRAGVVDAQWKPYSLVALPSLSRGFLSADDAARHAHERIGARRDREYGGTILQRADGRYVATEPVATGPWPFAFAGLYPKDRQGAPIILHAGCRLQGLYGSRIALSLADPAEALTLKWTRQDAELNGQMFRDQDVHPILQAGVTAYLSGAEDCLIAYQPGHTTAEWMLHWQAEAISGISQIAKNLANGTMKPADVVRKLAEAGTLRVVIGNALWGPSGSIELDWGPYVRSIAWQRPEQPSHGALFESADAAALDALARVPYNPEQHRYFFCFILKHTSRNDYVASECVPITLQSPMLTLASLYASTGPDTYQLPEGFECEALYYTNQWAGNGATAWLERCFMLPAHLDIAVSQARLITRGSALGAAVYIATPQGALLCYRSSSPKSLFDSQSEGDSLETIEAKLKGGTLEPLKFIRKVAEAGELRVVMQSPCWDRTGAVSRLWNPYANLSRRRLSPVFVSMDDAARYVRRRVAVTQLQAYGGLILRRDDGGFVASEPLVIADEVFDLKWIFPDELVTRGEYPIRTTVVASYHSRPASQWPFLLTAAEASVYSNTFSTRLLAHALAAGEKRLYHYLLGPDGSLTCLWPEPRGKYPQITEQQLVTHPKSRHDWLTAPLERQIRAGELAPSEYVNRIARSFTLSVVQGSAMWGEPGVVSGWSAFATPAKSDGQYAQARHEPAYSPMFIQADDAVRHVHGQMAQRSQLMFGYVLKSMDNGSYVATLPVSDGGSKLARRRVFSSAGYPYRYGLAGMYICVPEQADFYPAGGVRTGDDVYRGLFSPTELLGAFHQVQATTARSVLPMYFSCADGALLKFVARDTRGISYSDAVNLRLRLLSPTDYIQRVAAAGDLRVLQSSASWLGAGVVGAHWQPGRSRAVIPAGERQLGLGPLHAHRDDAAWFSQAYVGGYTDQQYLSALLTDPMGSSHLPVLPMLDDGFPSSHAEGLFDSRGLPGKYRITAAHLLFHAGLDQPADVAQNAFRTHFVSWRELAYYVHELKRKGLPIVTFYLSARDGALLAYAPHWSTEEYNLLATPDKWSAQTGYTAQAPTPSHFISELARIGQLRVVRSGDFWTVRGVLGAQLKLSISRPPKDEL